MAKRDKMLSEEETNELKKKAKDILSVCRRNLLIKYPFIGNVALRMNLIPVRDLRVRTACTDGDNVYFDIAFLSSLSKDEQLFVLAHEIWHAVLMHLIRRHSRLAGLFNIATDKEINNLLTKDGFNAPVLVCMPEPDEKDKCAEEIYEIMLNKMKNQKKQNMHGGMGGGMNGKGNSNGSFSNDSNTNNNTNNTNNNGSCGDDENDGKKNGTLSGQFDRHIYENDVPDINDGDGDGNNESGGDGAENNPFDTRSFDSDSKIVSDKYGQVGFDADYRPKVDKNFADKMREVIISEAQRTLKMRGSLPAGVTAMVDKILAPEIKWQELLAQFVTKCYNSGNYSWIPPNRRYVHRGIYLPRRQGDRIRIAVIIDTSGSTIPDRGKFLGELTGLIRSFGKFDLHLIECDAAVGAYTHFTEDDDVENIIVNGDYEMTGGGGTAMTPALEYIRDNELEVDAVCCMTDGYIDSIPKNPTNLPMLWIITKDGIDDFCDWGQKVKFKNDDDTEI